MFRSLVGDNIKTWDAQLCRAEFAHNHASNRSLGFSPFQVIYVIIQRCPLDLALPLDPSRFHGQTVDFVEELLRVHNQARDNLANTTIKYKRNVDMHRRDV